MHEEITVPMKDNLRKSNVSPVMVFSLEAVKVEPYPKKGSYSLFHNIHLKHTSETYIITDETYI